MNNELIIYIYIYYYFELGYSRGFYKFRWKHSRVRKFEKIQKLEIFRKKKGKHSRVGGKRTENRQHFVFFKNMVINLNTTTPFQ